MNNKIIPEPANNQVNIHGAIKGGPSILLRQIVTAGSTLAASLFLARTLMPAEFGIFALLTVLLSFFRVITEGGLGAALIASPSDPSPEKYKQIFTIQIFFSGLSTLFSISLITLLPENTFNVDNWKLALTIGIASILFSPIVSNAITFLERNLNYKKLGFISAIQPLSLALLSVLAVSLGFGVVGISLAALFSFMFSAVISRSTRAPIGFIFQFNDTGSLLRFGMPFAISQLLSSVKDLVVPVFLGLSFGAASAGLVSWAQQFAVLPTIFVISFSRYLFPVFSRLINNKLELTRAAETSLIIFNCTVAPLSISVILWPTQLTSMIYGAQWLDAINVLILLIVANFFSPTYAVLSSVVNAQGRPVVILILTLISLLGTWLLVPLFSIQIPIGIIGYGVTNILLQLPGLCLFVITRKVLKINYLYSWFVPWAIAGLILGGTRLLFESFHNQNLYTLPSIIISLLVVFVAYVFLYKYQILILIRIFRPKKHESRNSVDSE